MEIKDLQSNQGNIDLVLTITEKGDIRTFEKFGKQGRVCSTKVKDDSGEVKLTLWNEDIDKIELGDKIHLQNGWCSEYQGEKQLSTGKFGKIELIEKSPEPESPGVVTNDPNIFKRQMANKMSEEETELDGEALDEESDEESEGPFVDEEDIE